MSGLQTLLGVGPRSDAKRLLREAKRLLRKHKKRVPQAEREKVESCVNTLEKAKTKAVPEAAKALDAQLDKSLGFARKSPGREFVDSILVAFLIAGILRSFVLEAFKIPSSSMIPTLAVGDRIFVNKFLYGLRVPFSNRWFAQWGSPGRGDVIVFRYPVDQSKDYIKRTVAIAGDTVRVTDKQVIINGEPLDRTPPEAFTYVETSDNWALDVQTEAYLEESAGAEERYTVLYRPEQLLRNAIPSGRELPGLKCTADACVVEDGHILVLGDNRDNSADGRVWGCVPLDLVKGKAMFVWWSSPPSRWWVPRLERFGHPIH